MLSQGGRAWVCGCLEGQARERIHEAVSETASPRLDKGMRALASVDQLCLGGSSGEKERGWGCSDSFLRQNLSRGFSSVPPVEFSYQ